MYNMQQLAEAEHAVYIIANPEGTDCEFVPLKLDPATAKSVWGDLRARWAGRNLTCSGVAGVINGVPVVMMKEEPSDFLLVVRLTAAFAQWVADSSEKPDPQSCDSVVPQGDEVAFLERLWSLEDPRQN